MATEKGNIDQMQKNNRSTKPIEKEDPEETEIKKTRDITKMAFAGIEIKGAPGKIYTD